MCFDGRHSLVINGTGSGPMNKNNKIHLCCKSMTFSVTISKLLIQGGFAELTYSFSMLLNTTFI